MIRPLLLLELRRQWPMLLRMALLTAVVGVVFFAAGKRTPEHMLATLIGCSLGVVLSVPMGISRDKMEGTLDFICGLPVKSRDIAASRFAAMALLVLPWAAGIGALSIVAPGIGALNPAGVAILAWLTMSLLGACATALFARFDIENLLGLPMVTMIIAVVLLPRVAHALFPALTPAFLLRWVTSPAAPLTLASVALLAVTSIGTIAFGATVRGFSTHR